MNKEAEELDRLRNELYQEELEGEQRRREELKMRKKLEDRHVMLQAYEHSMEVKEVKLRRDMYDAERVEEKDTLARLKAAEGERQKIIDMERQRLLKEHAAPLREFLPKGTLETEADAQAVGFGFTPRSRK